MPIRIEISGELQRYSGCPSEIVLEASSVREALRLLQRDFSKLYGSVCDETGALRRHVNLFINSERVLDLEEDALDVLLRSHDVLTIWQSVSGG